MVTTGGTRGAYPRFSAAEMARRHDVLAALAEDAGVDELLLYGADRSGGAVQWATQWPVTREAVVLWSAGTEPVLFVQFANHVDNARRMAEADVRWGGPATFETVADALRARHPHGVERLGVIGSLPASAGPTLGATGAQPVFLDRAFQRARLVKSEEELEWVRRGVALTDDAVAALAGATCGMDEAELNALVEAAYVPRGGTTHIHYFAVTAMEAPEVQVPAQWPSARRLGPGDVLSCEISASWWGYPGQLLRTFTVEAEPTPRYAELHEVATAAFEAVLARVRAGTSGRELADAGRLVEKAGFTTCDDVVHGFVGGYLPPVVPGGDRPGRHDDFVLEAGMTVVVQPNVVTPSAPAGVQTGELVLVTADGHERLHRYPRGLGRIGTQDSARNTLDK